MEDDTTTTLIKIGVHDLHPEIGIAIPLFQDGHYQDAVRRAAQRFVNRVAFESEREDMHGRGLMNHVFSADKPILVFTERRFTPTERNIHNGFRSLAVGLSEAVRNIYTHEDHIEVNSIEAMEWLAFISAMHRRLDRAVQCVDAVDDD